jgi:hypothetical protein
MLVVSALLVVGALALTVGTATPALSLLAVVVIVVMAGGLLSGATWLIALALGLVVAEIGFASAGGSITSRLIPVLAVGLFLAIELSTLALEKARIVTAPNEPIDRPLLATVATAGLVGCASLAMVLVTGAIDAPGTFTQIAGVAAAAAVLASLAALIERGIS